MARCRNEVFMYRRAVTVTGHSLAFVGDAHCSSSYCVESLSNRFGLSCSATMSS